MMRYRITIIMDTPYNPNKWDWEELIASEPGEEIQTVRVETVEPHDTTERDDAWEIENGCTHDWQYLPTDTDTMTCVHCGRFQK